MAYKTNATRFLKKKCYFNYQSVSSLTAITLYTLRKERLCLKVI